MIKKINVAGIQLDNYTVREALVEMEVALQKNPFYVIEEIHTELLLMACKNELVKSTIEHADLTVISDRCILEAVNALNMQRRHETDNYMFFHEFMKRVEKKQQPVFWIGETVVDIQLIRDYAEQKYPRIVTVGMEALEECIGATDAIINEINAATPAVIISVLPSPTQEAFLTENKDKVLTNIWYSLGLQKELIKPRKGGRAFLRRRTKIRTLKKYMQKMKKYESYPQGISE